MGYKVKLSQEADADLDEILTYLIETLCAPKAAQRFFSAISKQLGLLCDNPHMYPVHHDERLSMQGLRFIAIGKYLLFYTVDDPDLIHVVRILYGKRDFASEFDT